jgi:hypothetical protein
MTDDPFLPSVALFHQSERPLPDLRLLNSCRPIIAVRHGRCPKASILPSLLGRSRHAYSRLRIAASVLGVAERARLPRQGHQRVKRPHPRVRLCPDNSEPTFCCRQPQSSRVELFHCSPRWHILYAGPAPGGVVVGQQLNPTMIPTVRLYEFQRLRHIPSITITAHDSSLTRWTLRNTASGGV